MKYRDTILRMNTLAQSLAFAFGTTLAGGALATVPLVSSYNPADNSLAVAPSANLVLNFNQIVLANTGKYIVIRKSSDNSVVETVAASNAGKVTLSSSKSSTSVTINPANDLALSTGYYVQIDPGAFIDGSVPVNQFAGISDSISWNFTTVAGATPVSYFPVNGATDFNDYDNLRLTFGEAMSPVVGKSIRVYSGATLINTIAVNDVAKVTFSGSTIVINPAVNLSAGVYHIKIDAGAFIGNVSGASYAGIADTTTWTFATVQDLIFPTATLSPANNAIGVLPTGDLVLSFNEVVTSVAPKNIVIKKSSDNSVVETVAATDTGKVAFSASKTSYSAIINPANNLAFSTDYYVQVDAGAFQDPADNPYAGISGTTAWKFTTAPGAALVSSNPANGATGVSDYADLSLTFVEPMTPVANRFIRIYKSDGTPIETMATMDSAKVTFFGSTVVINPSAQLSVGQYYVTIDTGAFTGSLSGVAFSGVSSPTTWAFSTVQDLIFPTATLSPVNNATGVLPTSNLVLTFSEDITGGPGKNIVIKKSFDNSVVETIAVTDTGKVAFSLSKSGYLATINPANNLAFDTDYYVQVDLGAFRDYAGNPYAGIVAPDTASWKFRTAYDNFPPVYTVMPYIIGVPAHNSATFSATTDEAGKVYYIAVPAAATAPTPTQVKAGVNYGVVTVLAFSNEDVVGNVAASLPVSLPSARTAYMVYFVAEDSAGNLQTSPVGVSVTTAAPPGAEGTLGATSYTFPSQSIGTTSIAAGITLTNTGTGAMTISGISTTGDYATTNNCGSGLGVGSFCTISFTFSPTANGTRVGTLTANTNAYNSPHLVSLSGVGLGSVVGLNPSALAFGNQLVNTTSAPLTSTLTNTGNQTINITSVTASGGFAVSNNCGSGLVGGGSCSVSVTFAPTTTGAKTGIITINSSSPTSPHLVSLSGTGLLVTAPVCTLTATPSTVRKNSPSLLTSSCSNAPTSYSWTGGTCAGTTAATCTVTPSATTTYGVTATNGSGSGSASATVTVASGDITPVLFLLLFD